MMEFGHAPEPFGIFAHRNRDKELRELASDVAGASYLRGDFVLSSGTTSDFYFDKYLFETKPTILRRTASFLAELVPARVDRLAAAELGAVALTAALSLETGIPFVLVCSTSRPYEARPGVDEIDEWAPVGIEGELHRGEGALVVADVINTGALALRAARQVEEAGATVCGVLAVIDREEGGAASIGTAGYPFVSLFRLRDFRLPRK